MYKKNNSSRDQGQSEYSSYQVVPHKKKNKLLKKFAKKKSERKRSGAPLGRPLKKAIVEVVNDPTEAIQKSVLKYLLKIGLSHGLIFKKRERAQMNEKAKMNDDQNKVKPWRVDHEWNEDQEKRKIDQSEYLQFVMKSFVEKSKTVLGLQLLTQAFMCIGEITTYECTMQMYNMMAAVLESYVSEESDGEFDARSTNLFKWLRYFSGEFTTAKIRNWVQIIQNVPDRLKFFVELMRDLKGKLIEIFLNPGELIDFLIEEQESNEALKKLGY